MVEEEDPIYVILPDWEPIDPVVFVPPPEVEKAINASCAQGFCLTEAAFSAQLSWDNCNDLDISIETPNGEIIDFAHKHGSFSNSEDPNYSPSGATLDIDAHADNGPFSSPLNWEAVNR